MNTSASSHPEALEVLLFQVCHQAFAVPVRKILEVMPLPPLGIVPRSPDYLLGVGFRGGRLLPIIDLAALLGLVRLDGSTLQELERLEPPLVVCQTELGEFGFLADSVLRVSHVMPEQLKAQENDPQVQWVFDFASQKVQVLDLEALGLSELADGGEE